MRCMEQTGASISHSALKQSCALAPCSALCPCGARTALLMPPMLLGALAAGHTLSLQPCHLSHRWVIQSWLCQAVLGFSQRLPRPLILGSSIKIPGLVLKGVNQQVSLRSAKLRAACPMSFEVVLPLSQRFPGKTQCSGAALVLFLVSCAGRRGFKGCGLGTEMML